MTTQVKWIRVSRKAPCEICQKPDWCTRSELGAACMRVESDHPLKNGGWLHKTGMEGRREIPHTPEPTIRIDADKLWREYASKTEPTKIKWLAEKLGVKEFALAMLGCCWVSDKKAYGFPMRSGDGKIIGLRLRSPKGEHWTVKGSRSGLFLPEQDSKQILFICEGESDTASALSMKLYAIGRPSCMGCEDFVNQYIKLNRVRRVILLVDNDEPGIRGGEKLQATLKVPSIVILPPLKDLRASFLAGMTAVDLQNLVSQRIWVMPK